MDSKSFSTRETESPDKAVQLETSSSQLFIDCGKHRNLEFRRQQENAVNPSNVAVARGKRDTDVKFHISDEEGMPMVLK